MKLRIDVMLKEAVLDPQGKAIEHALGTLGFSGVTSVRVGRVILLDIDAPDAAAATSMAEDMARKILANLVIEDFKITVL